MNHIFHQNKDFNVLTIKHEKKGIVVTGETKEPLCSGDTISYPVGNEGKILLIKEILERRDSRDFPEGNGLFYSVNCVPHMPEEVKK